MNLCPSQGGGGMSFVLSMFGVGLHNEVPGTFVASPSVFLALESGLLFWRPRAQESCALRTSVRSRVMFSSASSRSGVIFRQMLGGILTLGFSMQIAGAGSPSNLPGGSSGRPDSGVNGNFSHAAEIVVRDVRLECGVVKFEHERAALTIVQ